jgi:hypothetical protein
MGAAPSHTRPCVRHLISHAWGFRSFPVTAPLAWAACQLQHLPRYPSLIRTAQACPPGLPTRSRWNLRKPPLPRTERLLRSLPETALLCRPVSALTPATPATQPDCSTTPPKFPDVVEKVALDPGWGHCEAVGIQRHIPWLEQEDQLRLGRRWLGAFAAGSGLCGSGAGWLWQSGYLNGGCFNENTATTGSAGFNTWLASWRPQARWPSVSSRSCPSS